MKKGETLIREILSKWTVNTRSLKLFSSQVITIALCHNFPWVKKKKVKNKYVVICKSEPQKTCCTVLLREG